MKRIAWILVGLPLEMLSTTLGTMGLLVAVVTVLLACGAGCRAAAPDATVGEVAAGRDAAVRTTSAGLFSISSEALSVGAVLVCLGVMVFAGWVLYLSHVRSVHKTDALANSRPADGSGAESVERAGPGGV